MARIWVSLWLPIGRTNFFNLVADKPMLTHLRDADVDIEVRPGEAVWLAEEAALRADSLDESKAVTAQLQVSVLRRLLEVLPEKFGYRPYAACAMSANLGDGARPVSARMTLRPRPGLLAEDRKQARAAQDDLATAEVTEVTVTVDQYGNYTFTADVAGHPGEDALQTARDALKRHVVEFFGGDFRVTRLRVPEPGERWRSSSDEGVAAIRRYAGLDVEAPVGERAPNAVGNEGPAKTGPPAGALNFFQLNLVTEGLCNESLLPAVYLEHHAFVLAWQNNRHRAAPIIDTIGGLVTQLTVDVDATTVEGKMATLHRFLAVTSRETLQRLKWSVESARRSLLDEMLGSTHRQTRLVQLNLGASDVLRTPELAEQASESQLRGYIMLVGAKFPVISNAGAIIDLAMGHIEREADRLPGGRSTVAIQLEELLVMRAHWRGLLGSVKTNIEHLDSAVEHEWRERMLYEQEQARDEQEALSEIERSRRGRGEFRRVGDGAYNAVMMILTVLAVLYAVRSIEASEPTTTEEWLRLLANLWPVAVTVAVLYLLLPTIASVRRWWHERTGSSESYSYEFAIRIGESAKAVDINKYINGNGPKSFRVDGFPKIRIIRRANGRIEATSPTNFVFKVHTILVYRAVRTRYARFEVVHEILARTGAGGEHYVLLESRVFGDTPKPIDGPRLVALARAVLTHTAEPVAGKFRTDPVPAFVVAAYDPKVLAASPAAPAVPAKPGASLPAQRTRYRRWRTRAR